MKSAESPQFAEIRTLARIKCTMCHPYLFLDPFGIQKSKLEIQKCPRWTDVDGWWTDTFQNHPSKTPIIRTFRKNKMQKAPCLPGGGRIQPQDRLVFTGKWTDG